MSIILCVFNIVLFGGVAHSQLPKSVEVEYQLVSTSGSTQGVKHGEFIVTSIEGSDIYVFRSYTMNVPDHGFRNFDPYMVAAHIRQGLVEGTISLRDVEQVLGDSFLENKLSEPNYGFKRPLPAPKEFRVRFQINSDSGRFPDPEPMGSRRKPYAGQTFIPWVRNFTPGVRYSAAAQRLSQSWQGRTWVATPAFASLVMTGPEISGSQESNYSMIPQHGDGDINWHKQALEIESVLNGVAARDAIDVRFAVDATSGFVGSPGVHSNFIVIAKGQVETFDWAMDFHGSNGLHAHDIAAHLKAALLSRALTRAKVQSLLKELTTGKIKPAIILNTLKGLGRCSDHLT